MPATGHAGVRSRLQEHMSRRCIDHTIRLLTRWTRPSSRILDIGCGSGALAHVLEGEMGYSAVHSVDVIDLCRFPLRRYQVCDTTALPFDDGSFDMTVLSFVLHHVPDEQKVLVLREAARVSRGGVFILEDTPEHLVDHVLNWLHGWTWQMRCGHRAAFGFHSQHGWQEIFASLGLEAVVAERLSRLERPGVPSARSCFLVERARDRGPRAAEHAR